MTKPSYLEIRARLNFKIQPNYWVRHLALDAMLLALGVATKKFTPYAGTVLLDVVVACVLFRAFSAMHEAVHGILKNERRFNDWLGIFFGAACFLPFAQWKAIHLEHHQWAGNIEKDPVAKLPFAIRNGWKPNRFIEIGWKTWLPVLAVLQHFVFWSRCVKLVLSKRLGLIEFFSIVAPITFWATLTLLVGAHAALTVLLPSTLIYLALTEIVNFPHHLELPQNVGDTKLKVLDQHAISRSCTYAPFLERYILLNFNYHCEHHLFPTLPFYELASAFTLVNKSLGSSHNVEKGFDWVLRNRKKDFADVLSAPPEEEARPIEMAL